MRISKRNAYQSSFLYIAIHDLIAEVRSKQKQWLEFVAREGLMVHWAHPDSFAQKIRTSSVPKIAPFTTHAASQSSISSVITGLEGENMVQTVELDCAFEEYIHFELLSLVHGT